MANIKKQFILNTCSGWLAQLSAAAVGFIMLPYNLSHLGKELYGINVLAVTTIAMLQFLSLGMGPALLRFFSQAIAKDDKREIKALSSTAQCILGALGLVGAILIVAIIPWFLRFYEVPQEYHRDTTILLICMACSFFIGFHGSVFNSFVLAHNRYDFANIRSIVASWLRMILLVSFYNTLGPSLACMGMALLIGGVYNYLALITMSYRESGSAIFFSYNCVVFDRLPELFSFSFLSLLSSLFYSASIQVPLLIIGKTLGKESATMFSPAVIISFYLSSLMGQISNPLVPIAARDKICNGSKNIGRWAIQFGQIVSCVGCGCICLIILFIPDILRIWLGQDFISMGPTIIILVIGITYAYIQAVNSCLATGANTIAPGAYSAVIMAVLTSLGTLLGTVYWNWGLFEVACCITVVRLIRNTFFLTWMYSILFPYSFYEYFYKVYIRPGIGGIALLSVVLILKHRFMSHSPGLMLLGMEIAVVALVYALTLWYFGLSRETRSFLLKHTVIQP